MLSRENIEKEVYSKMTVIAWHIISHGYEIAVQDMFFIC